MPWLKWLPWRFFLRHIAKAHGFIDPIPILSRLRHLAEPSEVGEPVELLRAGMVFHARGLINSRVIQHNLDWIWPYWVEQQFDPGSISFIPRGFSITHINLTHRNWTAIGYPNCPQLPVIDPRGLLTPLEDGWSLETIILAGDGDRLIPSREDLVKQRLIMEDKLAVSTRFNRDGLQLTSDASIELDDGSLYCHSQIDAQSKAGGWLVVLLRPYNPEGISFVHKLSLSEDRNCWCVENKRQVEFDTPVQRHHISDYRAGDVCINLHDLQDQNEGVCAVGMVTAAAMFALEPCQPRQIRLRVPLGKHTTVQNQITDEAGQAVSVWSTALQGGCRLQVRDKQFQMLFDAAIRTLIILSPNDIYPGPYTYKRFWFRDAAFMVNALLCAGLTNRAERILDGFPERQTVGGYFHSQQGEWDANGQVLWVMHRFSQLTGKPIKPRWLKAVERGANWIVHKRKVNQSVLEAGLLPAGFSAEHLGPIDNYYWDNFWGIAGLQAASSLFADTGQEDLSRFFRQESSDFQKTVDASLSKAATRLGRAAMPAAPNRRLDAGAIGSIVAGYPLRLYDAQDNRLSDTVEFLLGHCFVDGGFFQDMVHSGINPYLTLHVAQILLRAGDDRYLKLMRRVADLATDTGQWPEAIHPATKGGCMGDGQHGWAAGEWVLMVRECFVTETNNGLLLCTGIPGDWLEHNQSISFGPAPTSFGSITLTLAAHSDNPEADEESPQFDTNSDFAKVRSVVVSWQARWFDKAPAIKVQLPGFISSQVKPGQQQIKLAPITARTRATVS